jgi:hypothetical protein
MSALLWTPQVIPVHLPEETVGLKKSARPHSCIADQNSAASYYAPFWFYQAVWAKVYLNSCAGWDWVPSATSQPPIDLEAILHCLSSYGKEGHWNITG